MSVLLIWITLFISLGFTAFSKMKVIPEWPKVFIVSVINNILLLAFYYHPDLYGYTYYLCNVIRVIPLILILVYLAQQDPKPNWTYRAMCLLLIGEIIVYGWHILSGLNSPYYDGLSMATTVIELCIVVFGGFNVERFNVFNNPDHCDSTSRCSNWVYRDKES